MNIKSIIKSFQGIRKKIHQSYSSLNEIQASLGRIESRLQDLQQLESNDARIIENYEFKVYSQWGEDGIIQFLLKTVPISKKKFIEFGVENYLEANTRFLLRNDNWSGLIIDGSQDNIDYIHKDPIYWRHDLKAVCSFITKDNINDIFKDNGVVGDIGILSIDIDGNDYWVWQAIDIVKPAIVIVEYNSRLGKEKSVTIPYDPKFIRSQAHHSHIYYGTSLRALVELGKQKGYAFVGCNSNGVNAFFVRNELKPDIVKELSVDEGYVCGKCREARDTSGKLLYLSLEEERKILDSLPFVNV